MFRGMRVSGGLKVVLTDSDVDELVLSADDDVLAVRWRQTQTGTPGGLALRVPGIRDVAQAFSDEGFDSDAREMTVRTGSGHRLLLQASAFGVFVTVCDALGRCVGMTFAS